MEYQRRLDVAVKDFGSQIKLLTGIVSGVQEQLTALREIVYQNTKAIKSSQVTMAENTEDIEIIKTN